MFSSEDRQLYGTDDVSRQGSYIEAAKEQGHTYFHMEVDTWNEALSSVDGNMDEMWRIKKWFLDEQAAQNKTFDFFDDPNPASDTCTGLYRREIAYIRKIGYLIVKQGGRWRAYK